MRQSLILQASSLILGIFLVVTFPKTSLSSESLNNAENDLGVVVSPELKTDAVGIKECGLSTWVKQKLSYASVKTKGNNLVFLDNTKEIFWFAQFTISGSFKNDTSRNYQIQWISPGGNIFQEEKFKSSLWNETFIKKSIKFKKIPIEDHYIGRWRVKVWKGDTLVDDRIFEIIRGNK